LHRLLQIHSSDKVFVRVKSHHQDACFPERYKRDISRIVGRGGFFATGVPAEISSGLSLEGGCHRLCRTPHPEKIYGQFLLRAFFRKIFFETDGFPRLLK